MKILLTGGSGFIGEKVLKELALKKDNIVCLYNRNLPSVDLENIDYQQFDLLAASSRDFNDLIRKIKPTHCLHIAWYTNHADYLTADINVDWLESSKCLIDAFYKNGGRRFIGTGTCIEYDTSVSGFYSEDKSPIKPNTLYAECKLKLYKFLMQNVLDNDNFSAAWARIFFVYGPNDRDNRLIPYIIKQLFNRKLATPRFGGLKRDYNYVGDLANQLVEILYSNVNGAINTGSGKVYQIQEFFDEIGEQMGSKELVNQNYNLPKDLPEIIGADISKYLKEVNRDFIPTSLKVGLNSTIQDFCKCQ